MFSCSHQSIFDRLYAREKKLYQEVRNFKVLIFAAGMGFIYAQQLGGDPHRRMAEIALKVLRAGMSVANSSLTEFAIGSAKGYAEYVK
uniref:DUF632 domain-containing protein n=1 Tax=Populus trichocarpa TaxID=3694 RepID=B9IN90_POPTR